MKVVAEVIGVAQSNLVEHFAVRPGAVADTGARATGNSSSPSANSPTRGQPTAIGVSLRCSTGLARPSGVLPVNHKRVFRLMAQA